MILKNGNILFDDFIIKKSDISINYDKISFETSTPDEIIDCTDCFIIPGLIDIHTHGAMGYDNMDLSYDAINTISSFMAENGVTTYLPTVMTHSHQKMLDSCRNIKAAYDKGVSGAKIGGIYMEGPYFSEKYKGAQNPNYLRNPDPEEFREFFAQSGELIKIISLAPETAGADEFIKTFNKAVKVFIGHTDSDYETCKNAIICGAEGLTHTFNGMRPLHHRTPNAIGAALDGGIFCECICDGFHLSPTAVRLIYKCAGRDKLVLISDSLRPTGLPDGRYESGGQSVNMVNGEARLEDGTIAGSSAKLFDCMIKAVSFGIPFEDAVRAATINPAKAAGIDNETGSIAIGKKADMLILNKDYSIRNVIIDGKKIILT